MGLPRRKRRTAQKTTNKQIGNIQHGIEQAIRFFEERDYQKSLSCFLHLAKQDEVQCNVKMMVIIAKNIGALYFKLQEYEKSYQYYQEAWKYTETDTLLFQERRASIKREMELVTLLQLATRGNIEEVLTKSESLLEKYPHDLSLLELRGDCLCNTGKYEEAILCYEELAEVKNIPVEDVYHKIGVCYFHLNDLKEAWNYFVKGHTKNPHHVKICFALGELAFRQEDYYSAITYLRMGERLAPREVDSLVYLAESYRQTDQIENALVTIEKIARFGSPASLGAMIGWLKITEENEWREIAFFRILELVSKRPAVWEEFKKNLARAAWPPIELFEKIRSKERRKGNFIKLIDQLLNHMAEELEKKRKQVEELHASFSFFFEKKEIETISEEWPEGATQALEYKMLEKIITRHHLPQEWISFASAMKETQPEVVKSLKAVSLFMEALEEFDERVIVTFNQSRHGGLRIEETMGSVNFIIFPDFPGRLKTSHFDSLVSFYRERLAFWETLPDLIEDEKFIPPPLPRLQQWAKKNGKILPEDNQFKEELEREGNNLKLDLLMQKIKRVITEKAKPAILLLESSNSIPFNMRFREQKATNANMLIAQQYYSYIRNNTAIKL